MRLSHLPSLTLVAFMGLPLAASEPAAPPNGLLLPECVVQAADSALYCSNIGGGPASAETVTKKDGDGFISLLNADGSVKVLKQFPAAGQPALNAPKGMAIHNGLLFVTDIDRVVAIELATGAQKHEIAVKDAKFLNDVAVSVNPQNTGEWFVIISDSLTDKLHAVKGPDLGTPDVRIESIPCPGGPNGISLPGGEGVVDVAHFSFEEGVLRKVVHYDWKGPDKQKELPFPAGKWDGLQRMGSDLYATDWASGALWVSRNGAEAVKLAEGMQGPADFCVLADGSAALVPCMVEGKVRRIELAKPATP